ncbi:MAG: cupin domain-containing protein [Burkholderiales bacterium]|nr:cupin domain-containing protein [Burkholderiales bacterium]
MTEETPAAKCGGHAGPDADYKVIRTRDFVLAANPRPGERQRIEILSRADRAGRMAGIFGSIPPVKPGAKPAYHFHRRRESIIQILSGDATELVEGKPVPLKVGDVIFLRPNVRHTLVNNSATAELKYMEFYTPAGPDVVRVAGDP